MTSLFIDWSNLKHRALYVALKDNPWDTEKFVHWKQIMFNLLRHYVRTFSPTEVVVAGDVQPSWRKQLWPDYKANRNHSSEYHERLRKVEDEYWETLSTMLPNVHWLRMPFVEADDIIATLAETRDNDIVCVSSDKDFVQLLRRKNFRLYDPNKNEFVACEDPEWQLKKKILLGDKSDNIPGIKRGLGPKKAEALRDPDKFLAFLESDPEAMANYSRNATLIDMAKIPPELRTIVRSAYGKRKGSFDPSVCAKTFIKLFPTEMTSVTEVCAIFFPIA